MAVVVMLAVSLLLLAGPPVTHAQTGDAGSAPDTPDRPSGSALWVGMIDLHWDEVTGADSYDVQYFHVTSWIDLPSPDDEIGIDIAFYGAGAVVKGLSHSGSYTFRVRAVNSHGASGWSDYGWVQQTDGPSAWVDVPEPVNVPATGKPRFNGSLAAGELLTADTSGISDENGLERVKFYYQWISSDGTTDTDIAGANEDSYRLSKDESGRFIRVRVSFTDRRGFPESLTGAGTGVVNWTAAGMLTINGKARVGETLTASASDIQDEDGLDNATFSYQWVSSDGTADTDIEGATGTSYTLTADHRCKTIKVQLSFVDDAGNQETLISAPAAEYVPPPPTEVAVAAEPIVLESTTADYFVLYASHTLDGTTVWDPVQVTLGQEGTTTLAENLAPLPVDRYRAEKYLVADPGDVDSDCIDDITELGAPATMNPVNPNGAIDIRHGATAIPDQETFDALSLKLGRRHVIKFVVVDIDTERPRIYFMNTRRYGFHGRFLNALGVDRQRVNYHGSLFYLPDLQTPDGSSVDYHYTTGVGRGFNGAERVHTLMAAHVPLATSNLGVFIRNEVLHKIQAELPLYQASRLKIVFTHHVQGQSDFLALNQGEGYGLLRSLGPDERPHSRDVVIYETLPNELPRVAGIISTVPQTPLSHVNLRALQDSVPNAFIADALEDDEISGLIGNYVYYAVTEGGYSIREATQAEVEAHYASSRPAETQTPQRDLTATSITALSDIGFDDWDAFGVKAANVAVLGTLGFPDGTVPDGFAVPFYFYDEFMKHNELYDDIQEMLADEDFQTDYDTKVDELKKLRKKIKKGDTPTWMEEALTTVHATYPEGQSLRYRSSTNNEDLQGFSGAGLYDSKTQHPDETEEDGISKSLKQVYASLWNFRAFIERDFHRIDHLATAMGVLVHPNYSDELVNGVAVSFDPAYGEEGSYYVNSQVGEDLVTNPEANSVPEEVLLRPNFTHRVIRLSNQAQLGQMLMTNDQMAQLRRHLSTVHERFSELYGFQDGERFAMEIEFKITSENALAIKQARPWVFAPLIGNFVSIPSAHHGANFDFRIQFSEDISIGTWRFANRALEVTGGEVISAGRVEYRDDLWEVSIAPDSDEDVTIVLNHDVPCTVRGAICTADGRRLSVRLEQTVVSGANMPATGAPTISGTLQVGETLTADTSGIADEDGLEDAVFRYQWIRNDGTDDADIPNATNPSYLVVAPSDGGNTIKVRVSFTDDAGNEESLTSASTAAVNATVPGPSRSVDVQTSDSGQLTVSWEAPAFDGGSDITGYTIQWREATASWDSSADVSSATTTATAYTISNLSPGTEHTVRVVATNAIGDGPASAEESVTPNSLPTGQPVIRGTSAVGEILSVDTSGIADAEGLSNPAFSYQWLADDAEISGAAGANYTLTSADRGKTFKVRVSFTDDAGNEESLTSPPLDLSAPYGLSATVFGNTVVLNWESPMNFPYLHDYQILRNRPELGEAEPLVYVDTGNDETTYTDADVEPGVLYVYRVKAASFWVGKASEPVEIRTPARTNTPATGAPTIRGTVQVGETLAADTSGIADDDGLTSVAYSYQWLSGDGVSETDITGAASSTYTLSDDEEGKTVKVRVSFTDDAGNEESLTSEATALVEAAAEEVVWESELTVGRVPNVFPHALGYPVSEDHGGSLSPDHFEIDGSVYNVDFLLQFAQGLWLGLDRELPVEFTLSAGESVYEGSESKVPVTGNGSGGYWWPSGISGWSLDESVRVSLNIQPREPMASREKAPLIAYLTDIPSDHDGQGTFTFELEFTEEPEPDFSYKTLRDHALTVTGGSVENARRLNKPSNIRWDITVRPDGNGQVTVILPATRDCAAQGAICTGDGRMLFNRIELTVPGPAS